MTAGASSRAASPDLPFMLIAHSQSSAGGDMSLRCEVVTDLGGVESLRDGWDSAVLELNAPVCMTFDWVKAWWDHYGEGRELRAFLFWRGEHLIGVLPLYLEAFGTGPWKTVVARIVGANLPPRCFNPPMDAASAADAFAHVHHQLFTKDSCDLLSFGPISDRWPAFRSFGEVLQSRRQAVGAASYRKIGVQMLLTLSAEFADRLRSSKTAKRSLRELEKHGGISTDVVSEHPKLQPAFEAFKAQHAAQWRAQGRGGHFTAWPRSHEFHGALVKCQGQLGRVRIYRILANGEMIAATYNYVFGRSLFAELTSRAIEAEWGKLGLGNAINVRMFQSAISEGLTTVDLGLGDYAHKVILGGEAVPVGTWRLAGPRWPSRIRSSLFLAIGRLVDIVYHKTWYRRIVPRLPHWFGRSQSRFWLRFDA